MKSLLDVNVLLALLDSDHVHHARAREWFRREVDRGWATCAITQNGFVRVISQSRYPNSVPATVAVRLLSGAVSTPLHQFWSCDLSLLDGAAIDVTRVHGGRQITDAYLLALAVSRNGRLATFDRSIPLGAVRGARPEHLERI
jgi:toxin-antitoxin system PIN domain toxin